MSVGPLCSFCGASHAQRLMTITAPGDESIAICNQCIDQSARILRLWGAESYTFWLGAEAEHV